MNTPSNTASTVLRELHPPMDRVIAAISSPVRWSILGELCGTGPLIVVELADRLGYTPSLISKHMAVLLKAGMVTVNRARQYQIPAHFVMSAAERHADYGHCLLRLPGAKPA